VHPQIHPGVLREVMLARIAGDVAGAPEPAATAAKRCRSWGCWPGSIPSIFPITRTGMETRHTQRLSLGLRHSTTRCAQS
jgi:hypothetical protein